MTRGGEERPHPQRAQVEDADADADHHHATCRRHLEHHAVSEDAVGAAGECGQRALVEQYHHRAQPHAPAERRGEDKGHEAVEAGLDEQQLVFRVQAVLHGAEHGKGPDAEHQARGDEAFDEAVVFLAAREPRP